MSGFCDIANRCANNEPILLNVYLYSAENSQAIYVHRHFSYTYILWCFPGAGAESFADAMKMSTEVHRLLEKKIVETQGTRGPLPVNDIGAFVPELDSDRDALSLLDASIKDAGYEGKIMISLDMSASTFFKEGGRDSRLISRLVSPGRIFTCTYTEM